MGNLIDILSILLIKRRIRKGFGADCPTLDYEDFPDHAHELNAAGRCGSCQAQEVVAWLDYWRSLASDSPIIHLPTPVTPTKRK